MRKWGAAFMPFCFGPSVYFLFKKRLDGYSTRQAD
jgi:hypothetical protein